MIQAEIGSGARRELANAAEQLVRERYTQKFSLDALADAVHVDKSYLLRTFKKMKGTTLLAFHNLSPEIVFRELRNRRNGGNYHKFE